MTGSPEHPGFTARLKSRTVGDERARFVYLNNFEVERSWGRDDRGLPGAALSFSSVLVNRMEEVCVLLADQDDLVILKAPVDPHYLDHLRSLGAAAGDHLLVDDNDVERSVTRDALASPRLLAELAGLADGRTYLMPLGISADEEELAARTGLPLAGPDAKICRHVNGKIFSRELVDRTGLTPVPGKVCRTLGELESALLTHLELADQVVVKESLGVSGRGMTVLDNSSRAERLVRMLGRHGSTTDLSFVVEEWISRRCDLNYQFIVDRDGGVHFETVRTALTRNGVHRGHILPPDLDPDQIEQIAAAAQVIGSALAAEGYYGLAGVDAMIGTDGVLYPCLEINARFNMATYQNRLVERLLPPGSHAMATVFDLRTRRPYGYGEVRRALADLMFNAGRGVLVNNFATLNASVEAGKAPRGRLYAVCAGGSPAEVKDIRDRAEIALTRMVETA
ncbi:ATP-grasp domain-containing protein [Micromonospora marina]|uniref:ATP-grasp domain-containing protein n=1 Tax=Micromonospora marina TaxID=307120 RepID=A0A1C5AIJ0_9ACTN|nr:ATP-grasp domain-containing protein [Micromonospora marina]SCF44979.1 ATP-grasp domain-containing protein [Micromonospora marina]